MLIIDRFEDKYAVCELENGKMVNIEKTKIPKEAREGDVLININGMIKVDIEETKKRKNEIECNTSDLWK